MISERMRSNFRLFNDRGGKFRVSIINACNLKCFFCHNEGMDGHSRGALSTDDLIEIVNSYTDLGGKQVNITGGEPLAHPELARILTSIDKRETRVVLNTNGILADRLLRRDRIENLDTILISLHTVDNEVFRRDMEGRDIRVVMRGILALRDHGYHVKLNLSLGESNRAGFGDVLRFAVENEVDLKVIALVRPNESPDFYHGDWVDPAMIADRVEPLAERFETHEQLGGQTTTYYLKRSVVDIKNIAQGRLHTDFCGGCPYMAKCGEGIYGLRIGVDGLIKQCLLRHERYRPIDRSREWGVQILEAIDEMVGCWSEAHFAIGAPR